MRKTQKQLGMQMFYDWLHDNDTILVSHRFSTSEQFQ